MDNRASEKNGTTVPPHSNNRSITDSECGVSEFLDDLVSLAELQLELTFVDFTKNARKAALPLALTLSSLTVTAATVPLLLHGLSLLIATWLNIQQGWAALLVATGTAALALPAAGFGVVCLSAASTVSALRRGAQTQPRLDTQSAHRSKTLAPSAWRDSLIGGSRNERSGRSFA